MKLRIATLVVLLLILGLICSVTSNNTSKNMSIKKSVLAEREISLNKRQNDKFVNNVFKYNILLNLAYLRRKVTKYQEVKEDEVTKSFYYELKLKPQEVFAFHNNILPEYKDKVSFTTNAYFGFEQGFKSDGYLYGDGVCHLASLIYWAAKDAKLDAVAPTNHDFRDIPEIPREFGVSIYYMPGADYGSALQNLYIRNNRKNLISLNFHYEDDKLKVSVVEQN